MPALKSSQMCQNKSQNRCDGWNCWIHSNPPKAGVARSNRAWDTTAKRWNFNAFQRFFVLCLAHSIGAIWLDLTSFVCQKCATFGDLFISHFKVFIRFIIHKCATLLLQPCKKARGLIPGRHAFVRY